MSIAGLSRQYGNALASSNVSVPSTGQIKNPHVIRDGGTKNPPAKTISHLHFNDGAVVPASAKYFLEQTTVDEYGHFKTIAADTLIFYIYVAYATAPPRLEIGSRAAVPVIWRGTNREGWLNPPLLELIRKTMGAGPSAVIIAAARREKHVPFDMIAAPGSIPCAALAIWLTKIASEGAGMYVAVAIGAAILKVDSGRAELDAATKLGDYIRMHPVVLARNPQNAPALMEVVLSATPAGSESVASTLRAMMGCQRRVDMGQAPRTILKEAELFVSRGAIRLPPDTTYRNARGFECLPTMVDKAALPCAISHFGWAVSGPAVLLAQHSIARNCRFILNPHWPVQAASAHVRGDTAASQYPRVGVDGRCYIRGAENITFEPLADGLRKGATTFVLYGAACPAPQTLWNALLDGQFMPSQVTRDDRLMDHTLYTNDNAVKANPAMWAGFSAVVTPGMDNAPFIAIRRIAELISRPDDDESDQDQ